MKRTNNFQVEKDGNKYICFGAKFVNLQESYCYAYGNTRKEAIKNFLKEQIQLTIERK